MPALEYQPPESDLVARIRQGLERHLDIHARPATREVAAPRAPEAPAPEPEEDARIHQAALEAFFHRRTG